MSADAFQLLARPIQHALWDMQWGNLRPIQVQAIYEVLTTDHDVVIAARTASGKTEAAFLPILSRLDQERPPSVGAMYVGPLKALINDQFRRLEDLCERADIPVHRWHGDVDAGRRKKLMERPGGVLLITPESLESFFVNRANSLERTFSHLQFVVIDEVHSLIGRERGLQLRSQLFRLNAYTNASFRIVALSATIGNATPAYKTWLRPTAPADVAIITDGGERKRVRFRIEAYLKTMSVAEARSRSRRTKEDNDVHETTPDEEQRTPPDMLESILRGFCGKKNLIFCNSREDVELLADALNDGLKRKGYPSEFLVHHGSLSREIRQQTESAMREKRPATAVCSSTLELGIDIGNLNQVGQIGPTWSVSSMVQRLGRSGRGEGEAQAMQVFVPLGRTSAGDSLVDRLCPDLLQAIAMTELMRSRWVEPPELAACDWSTLAQQVLSMLCETGGANASILYQRLVTSGAFRRCSKTNFAKILRSLGRRRLIEQTSDSQLILAPEGEKLAHDFDFYSVFETADDFVVRYDGRLIGKIARLFAPPVGSHLLLGGRRWLVDAVDAPRGEIFVVPSQGRKAPRFSGGGGEIHARIREEMKNVLLSTAEYGYLGRTACSLLADARLAAAEARLSERPMLATGDEGCLWFTWTGTKIQRTLIFLAKCAELDASDTGIAIRFDEPGSMVLTRLQNIRASQITDESLAAKMPVRELRKFDSFLDEELQISSLAADHIDLHGAHSALDALLRSSLSGAFDAGTRVRTVRIERPCLPNAYEPNNSEQAGVSREKQAMNRTQTPARSRRQHGKSSKGRQLSQSDFVAFDLETTGLSPTFARIVEIGAIRFRGDGTELGRFQQLVDPEVSIPPDAIEIHGISNDMVNGQPTIARALPEFIQFLGPEPVSLLAHNATFDLAFLGHALRRSGTPQTGHMVCDTLALARAMVSGLSDYRLQTIARFFGIQMTDEHRAIADAMAVKEVFAALMRNEVFPDTIKTLHQIAAVGPLAPPPRVDTPVPPGFENLATAILNGRSVVMSYDGGSKGIGNRRVLPLDIIESRGRLYLSAVCHTDDVTKTFRLDRIKIVRVE